MRIAHTPLMLLAVLPRLALAGIFTSTDVPKPIYDYQTTVSTVTVPSMTIWDVNVIIHDLRHTWLGDLVIWIQSPRGTSVVLFNRRGGRSYDLSETIFDDDALSHVSSGWGPFTGRFRPEEPLSAFIGQDGGGTWTLHVADLAFWDIGSLNAWSLEITAIPEPSTLALVAIGLLGAGLLRRRLA